MRKIALLAVVLLTGASAVHAQSPGQPAGGIVLAPLQATLDEDAPAAAFLRAARQAIAAGRVSEATEALERAESRALTRDVRPSLAGQPSDQKPVETIKAARVALASGDRLAALGLIDTAIKALE